MVQCTDTKGHFLWKTEELSEMFQYKMEKKVQWTNASIYAGICEDCVIDKQSSVRLFRSCCRNCAKIAGSQI